MRLHIHRKRYYLKKIQEGRLTKQEVADIYDTTDNIVEGAFEEYIKEQNPFKKKSFGYKHAIVQIVISLVSTLLVLFTLFEMKDERNAAYLPDILFGNTEVAFAWDSNDSITDTDEEMKNILSKTVREDTVINDVPQLKIYNIGVGTAKDIIITWNHEENMCQFINALEPYKDIEVTFEDDLVQIKRCGIERGAWLSDDARFDFMLNSTREYNRIQLPVPYSDLIRELYIRNTKEFPLLSLEVTYSDVQGVIYSKNMEISVQSYFYILNPSGNGCCVYYLILNNRDKNSMNYLLNSFNINSDNLIAVTSVCAVLISIASMIFTIIFSILQIKHNKNSVRPISAIKINDYENLISVRIDNVGTGPLLIKKLILKNDIQESSTLISMMPEIDQLWTTFTESIDGWTIPVGGKVTLLEIHPKSDSVKNLIRKELSKITVFLEYADIYATRFQDKRALDFFGRHSD